MSDDFSIPGSDYRAVDRQLDPDKDPLQSAGPDPVSQVVTSHFRSTTPVDNDRRDFRAKAAVPPKKKQSRSVVQGTLVVLSSVILAIFGVVTGFAMAGAA